MTTTPLKASTYIAPDIRIERMNTDKTRKTSRSDIAYQIFFDLSGSPAPEWKSIFMQQWKESRSPHKAELDGPFLVLHCPLHEMTPAQLEALQKTVATTNEVYRRFAQGEVTEVTRREEEWKQERKDVETVASSLHFG